ncbi:MAG: hypothetical protein BroJett042_28300 [Bacteroidota bacterium]|nr:MAG: hypothetical protein BroJett042_28300 [Bacteroidota bacterium]
MKYLYFLLFINISVFAQKNESTKSFQITGEVKSERKISIADFAGYRESALGDVVITNHLGEVKSTQKNLKGILLHDILEKVEFKTPGPKELSTFYIVCKATDGYTIVYSWNEIFNNPAGEAIYLITSNNGVAAGNLEESILMISPRDYKTGRRYLKGLAEVQIKRAL